MIKKELVCWCVTTIRKRPIGDNLIQRFHSLITGNNLQIVERSGPPIILNFENDERYSCTFRKNGKCLNRFTCVPIFDTTNIKVIDGWPKK